MHAFPSCDLGPDGFGPIDAVVTWVDGSDPAFRQKRQQAANRLKQEHPELAANSELGFAPARYIQHDEVRYCIRSILNHAPWVRRVWLVTDDQFPSAFDKATLDPRITLVSHRELFREAPHLLPTFNSGAIEAMLHRIEGISDRFISFNDDFFLSKPVRPQDFFVADKPVIRGKWTSVSPSEPGWLQRRRRSAELFGYAPERIFKEVHVPYSLSRPAIEAVFAQHDGLLDRMAGRRFRSSDDYYVVSLHNHFCLAEGRAVIDDFNRWLVFGLFPEHATEEEVRTSLQRIGSHAFLSTCFNILESYATRMPDVFQYMDAGAGPRLACER